MKANKCPSCGASLNGNENTCPYCNTSYKKDDQKISIEIRCLIKCWKSFGYTQTSKNAITTGLQGRRYFCQNQEGRESEHTTLLWLQSRCQEAATTTKTTG